METLIGLLIFVIAPISLLLFMAWFFRRYPPPPNNSESTSTDLFSALREYQDHYKGKVGAIVRYSIIGGLITVLFIRLYTLFGALTH